MLATMLRKGRSSLPVNSYIFCIVFCRFPFLYCLAREEKYQTYGRESLWFHLSPVPTRRYCARTSQNSSVGRRYWISECAEVTVTPISSGAVTTIDVVNTTVKLQTATALLRTHFFRYRKNRQRWRRKTSAPLNYPRYENVLSNKMTMTKTTTMSAARRARQQNRTPQATAAATATATRAMIETNLQQRPLKRQHRSLGSPLLFEPAAAAAGGEAEADQPPRRRRC